MTDREEMTSNGRDNRTILLIIRRRPRNSCVALSASNAGRKGIWQVTAQ